MAKINVLYLITKATSGGAQKYVYDLATNLPKDEFDVIVAYGEQGSLARDLASSRIKLRELPSLARDIAVFSDIKSFFEILKTFKELRPDVIHLNSSKAAALGALAARIAGSLPAGKQAKIIFTVHGWPFKENRNPLFRSFIYLASWITVLLSHAVIVVSKTDEHIARRMWRIGRKVHFVELGFAEFQTAQPNEGYRAMFGSMPPAKIRGSTVRLVTVGELTKNKGQRYAIEAVAELREHGIDAIYVIVGEGEDSELLQSLSKKLGVEDRVFFAGSIPNAAQNLAGFDVFVLPSIKEGTPYVLLEAARVGIPIVATDVVDVELAERVQNMQLVPPKDASALTDAIIAASKTPRTTGGRRELFPLSEMVRRTADFYR